MKFSTCSTLFAMALALFGCSKQDAKGTGPSEGTHTTSATPPAATVVTNVPGLKAGEKVSAFCDQISKLSMCLDFVSAAKETSAKEKGQINAMCPTATFTDACPSAKRVGTCQMMAGMIHHYYADGPAPFTAASASAKCKQNDGKMVP